MDSLILVNQQDLNFENRWAAMHGIDEIVQVEAAYMPFWTIPFVRIVHWDYLRFPEESLPPRKYDLEEHLIYWIDPERREWLERAMAAREALPSDGEIDQDFYGVREWLGR